MAARARRLSLACAVALALGAPLALSQDRPRRLLDFDGYYTVEEVAQALTRLQQAFPARAQLRSMGRSLEGRELWVLTIRNPLTGADADKPAIYVDGNTHGNELQATEVCLYLAQQLLTRDRQDPQITALVDRFVFHIAPCVNPDGRAAFLANPNTPHSSRRNRRPTDSDLDGLFDEDGYDDIDGDGEILRMRIRDPRGRWKDGEDPRIMVPCAADEPGMYELIGWEGIDDDGDGRFNEDPIGGVDLNRNFPYDWLPEHRQPGAGPYPLSEPETRATADFILDHPHIAAIQSFHNAGDMILRPPGGADDREVPREDLALYDALGRRGERLLPGYRYLQTYEDLYAVHGAFLDWGYMGLGVVTFTNELWSQPQDFNKDGQVSELERLRWSDDFLEGKGFIAWKPARHPQLGEVELGGWTKMSRRCPPAWQLEDLCYRNARFVLAHAAAMPRLTIADVQMAPLPENESITRVVVELVNEGAMPTATGRARAIGVATPDIVELKGAGIRPLTASLRRGARGAEEVQLAPRVERVELGHVPGQGRARITWLVAGSGTAQLEVRSEKGGTSRRQLVIGS